MRVDLQTDLLFLLRDFDADGSESRRGGRHHPGDKVRYSADTFTAVWEWHAQKGEAAVMTLIRALCNLFNVPVKQLNFSSTESYFISCSHQKSFQLELQHTQQHVCSEWQLCSTAGAVWIRGSWDGAPLPEKRFRQVLQRPGTQQAHPVHSRLCVVSSAKPLTLS